MEKKGFSLWFTLPAGAAGVLLALTVEPGAWGEARPLAAAGLWLRALSLGSAAGNAAAWAVVLLVSALPVAGFIALRRRRRRWEDYLVLLLAPELLAMLYYGVNPTLAGMGGAFFPAAILWTAASTLLAWLFLGLLPGLAEAPAERLAAAGRVLLIGCGILLAFSSAWALTAQWRAASEAVIQSNSAHLQSIGFTNAVQGILALLRLIPSLLGAMALVWAGQLVLQIGLDPFGEASLSLCGRTAEACRRAATGTVLLNLAVNLLQLPLYSSLISTAFHIELDLLPLALTAALFLLCRWFRQARALKLDNDSII